jgi:hypothetical protein
MEEEDKNLVVALKMTYGYPAEDGKVWIPTDEEGHGGPHWDVQEKGKGYVNIYPQSRKKITGKFVIVGGKNIQVIDGANNALYPIYNASEEDFNLIFPNEQDIEFADDFCLRLKKNKSLEILKRLWENPVEKKSVQGIHGTLFFDADFDLKMNLKKACFTTKKASEAFGGSNNIFPGGKKK